MPLIHTTELANDTRYQPSFPGAEQSGHVHRRAAYHGYPRSRIIRADGESPRRERIGRFLLRRGFLFGAYGNLRHGDERRVGIRDFGLFVFAFLLVRGLDARGASALEPGHDARVDGHEPGVTEVEARRDDPFPPPHSAVRHHAEDERDRGGVEDAIARHRFPVKTKGTAGEEDRRGDDDEDVEHRRANDGGHSELVRGVFGGEAHGRREKLGSGRSGRHERRSGDVFGEI